MPLLIFLVFSSVLEGQPGQRSQPIVLQYADSLIGTRGEGSDIRDFEGNVVLIQGNVTVYADKASQYINLNKAELIGNVRINQNELDLFTKRGVYDGRTRIASSNSGVKITDRKTVLTADIGQYSTATRIADFEQKVKIEDDSVIIFSDKLQYHRDNRNTYARGNVFIIGKHSNAYLLGDTLDHFPQSGQTIVRGNPRLFQIDTLITKLDTLNEITEYIDTVEVISFDTMTVKSETMRSKTEDGKQTYYFIDSVEIIKDKLFATADTAIYERTDGIIRLHGTPVVWYDSTQLFADSIVIRVPEMQLSELKALGNAIAVSRDDTSNLDRINQITGDEIKIKFENDSINVIFSFGNAKSLYFMSGDTTSEGVHRSFSDTLVVNFAEGEVNRISWFGAVNGEFFPENLIENPKTYYLSGFRRKEDKPAKIILEYKPEDKLAD